LNTPHEYDIFHCMHWNIGMKYALLGNFCFLFSATYPDMRLAFLNGTDSNLDPFFTALSKVGFTDITEYDGNYSSLLELKPHIAAFNVNVFNENAWEITAIYNDTTQHSLPIMVNLLNNAIYR